MIGILANTDLNIGDSIINISDMVSTGDHCLFGIFALLLWGVCLISFAKGPIIGGLINSGYLVLGLIIYMIVTHSSYGTEMMYLVDRQGLDYKLNTEVCVPSFFQERYDTIYIDPDKLPSDVYYLKDKDGIREIQKQLGYRTSENMLKFYIGDMGYAMNIKNSGRYLCPTWVCNPFSLVMVPGICSLPAIIFLGLLKGMFD